MKTEGYVVTPKVRQEVFAQPCVLLAVSPADAMVKYLDFAAKEHIRIIDALQGLTVQRVDTNL